MKQIRTLFKNKIFFYFLLMILIAVQFRSSGQTPLGDPSSHIYTMSAYGYITEINTKDATTSRTIVTFANYVGGLPDELPDDANAMGYSAFYGKFYYLKRNIGSNPQAFVSFDPSTGILKTLKQSTLTAYTVMGCTSYDGKGYYAIDNRGNLNYYNISSDSWTVITSTLLDENGTNISSLMDSLKTGDNAFRSGDMAIDGFGNLWCLISNGTNFALYKFTGPLPTTAVSRLKGSQILPPASKTPGGAFFGGIAFDANGKIFMSAVHMGSAYLYRLDNLATITYIGNLGMAGGEDLTSLNFPVKGLLPVTWENFTVNKENADEVVLNWSITGNQNKGFYIQHSTNGKDWTNIAFIQSKNTGGEFREYSYSYIETGTGKQYYRVQQVSADGSQSYSKTGLITIGTMTASGTLWPNPARNFIYVNNEQANQAVVVQLYDLSGRKSLQMSVPYGVTAIDINFLAPGVYTVRAVHGDEVCFTVKLVKQ